MKKKNLKVAIPLFILASGLVVGSSVLVSNAIKNDAKTALKAEYYMNDTVYVSKKQVNCNGVMKDGNITVKTPSGKSFSVKDSFKTTEFGRYEVIYSASYEGTTYSMSESFLTVRRATDLFTLSEGNLSDASLAQDTYMFDGAYYGVRATISAGASLYFNQIIDFNNLSMDRPLLSVLVEPHCASGADCSLLEFEFTDIDDPSNAIVMTYSAGDGYGYLRSGQKGGDQKGWQNYSSSNISKCHTNQFGNPMFLSFDRKNCETKNSAYPLDMYFEPESCQLYAARTRCYPWGTTPSYVIDYDSTAIWGENAWKGFTNGKATLKITPKQTASPNVTLFFNSIYTYDLSDDKFIDTEAPILSLEKIAQRNVAPQAKVGEPYRIFDCSAFDGYDGSVESKVEVKYVNPTNHALSDVSIKDGTFIPTIPGTYELVYSATDLSGNTNTRTVSVVASNNISPLEIAINDEDKVAEIFQDVNILPASAAKVSGGSGDYNVFRTIYKPNGRILDTKEDFISLDDVGNYKVVYEAIDYLGHHGSKTITIKSNNRDKPKIMGTFSFPDALLKGFTYEIPTLYAKECTSEGVITKEAVVLINGKQYKDPTFVADGESVRIQYVVKGSNGAEERITHEYEVRDGEEGRRQDKYFLCQDSDVVLERNYVEYNTTSDTNKTSFINKINSRSFTLVFNYDFNTFNADGVKVTLEDETRTHSYTLDVAISKTDSKLNYPGCVNQPTIATQYDNGTNKMRLSYNSAKGTVTDIDSNVLCSVTKDDNGKPFAGFNGYIYLTISIVKPDPVAGSRIMIERLSNQTLGYRAKDISRAEDTISPEIYLDYEFDRKQIIGSSFVVPKALSCDVLNPIETFTVEMYSRTEDGKVKDTIIEKTDAGVEHIVKLDKFDNYLIKYTSVDKAGNDVVLTRLLYVVENQPPMLDVDFSKIQKAYYFGDAVGLPTYKVSDNSGHYEVDIYVMDPHSRMYLLQTDIDGQVKSMLDTDLGLYEADFVVNKTQWMPEFVGEYKFIVVAKDSCHNYSSSEYVFHVVEK